MKKIDEKKVLFLMRGLPGSGKTTAATILAGEEYPVYEADMYFYKKDGTYEFDAKNLGLAHKWCIDRTEQSMKDETEKIFVSNTFTTDWEMSAYFKLAEKYGYTVFTFVVENRHGKKSIHNVPEESFKKMKDRFTINL